MDEMGAAYYHHHHHPLPPPSYSYYQQQQQQQQQQPLPQPQQHQQPYGVTPVAPPPPAALPQPQFLHSYHNPPPPLPYPSVSSSSSYLQPAPPPPLSASSHQYYDDVRTLFVAGLPEDVESREIYNLFREFPGYESSKLRRASEHNQPYGFAVFRDQQSAVGAMQALNGMMFDLEKQSTLYISLAKSNSKSKRSRTDDVRSGFSDKKFRGQDAYPTPGYDAGVGSNIHMPGTGNSAHNMIGYSSTQSHGFDSGAISGAYTKNTSAPYVPQNTTPCPTLFVANLGTTCSEQELIQVFSRWPGFLKLKMQNKNGMPVAFVDFQDVTCSTAALNGLQDTILYTSSGEGMRIEYAKSRMGKPKKGS